MRTGCERLSRGDPGTPAGRWPTWPATWSSSYFDEPVLAASWPTSRPRCRAPRRASRRPAPADRADRVDRLVWCPHPMRGTPAARLAGGARTRPRRRPSARRSWRSIPGASTGSATCMASTTRRSTGPAARVRQLRARWTSTSTSSSAYLPAGGPRPRCPAPSRVHLDTAPRGPRGRRRRSYLWRDAERVPAHRRAGRRGRDAGSRSVTSGAGCHRLDLTMTSVDGERHRRDAHPAPDLPPGRPGQPLVEDELLPQPAPHAGQAPRALASVHFDLSGCPLPRTSTCSRGRPRQPEGPRLFALAEVRDLVRGADHEDGPDSRLPRGSGGWGCRPLAAMRRRAGALPAAGAARVQPARALASGRPGTSRRATCPASRRYYEPLARGAGLEKLVLHIQVPSSTPRGGRRSARQGRPRRGHRAGGHRRSGSRRPRPQPGPPADPLRPEGADGRAVRRALPL